MDKINWFPGHMAASLKTLDGYIKLCDIIIYVLDARCPKSCFNPEFEKYTERKKTIFVYNKTDLAPANSRFDGISLDARKSNSGAKIVNCIKKLVPNKPRIHAIVLGVPNTGKSTIINNIIGKKKMNAANKPGVTRKPQWVERDGIFLLDTPGVLYPDLENQKIAQNLAFIGSIKDDILDIEMLAGNLLRTINYGKNLEEFAVSRGHIYAGGKLDLNRSAKTVLTEFRAGKFGRYNLDTL